MSGAASAQQENANDENIMYDEVEDDERKANGLIYNTIYEAGEKFAGTYVGQYVTGKVDRVLKLIEDTAKWSVPQGNDKNESREPLERPLPWIPFIAMILALRGMRLSLSIAGFLIGNAPILPNDVVYFIQTRRRKLRAIRITGMREIRRKEQAREQKSAGLVSKLRSMLSVVICKPGMLVANSLENQRTPEGTNNNKVSETNSVQVPVSYKRKAADDSCSDQDLTLDEIIDKYGNASSDDDSDFKPPQDTPSKDSCLSSDSTSSATSDDNDEAEDERVEDMRDPPNSKPEPSPISENKNEPFSSKNESTASQSSDNTVNIKENGQRADKQSQKPVPMPKPKKQPPVPIPINEIKQEPKGSDDERPNPQQQSKQSSEELKCPPQQRDSEKSVVALNEKIINTSDAPQDQCFNHDQTESTNGDRQSQIDHKSGSPNLNSNFGFQPTSILKNPSAVYLERRGPEVVYHEQNIDKKEVVNENPFKSKPESAPQQIHRGPNCYSGRANKNKVRGKRR